MSWTGFGRPKRWPLSLFRGCCSWWNRCVSTIHSYYYYYCCFIDLIPRQTTTVMVLQSQPFGRSGLHEAVALTRQRCSFFSDFWRDHISFCKYACLLLRSFTWAVFEFGTQDRVCSWYCKFSRSKLVQSSAFTRWMGRDTIIGLFHLHVYGCLLIKARGSRMSPIQILLWMLLRERIFHPQTSTVISWFSWPLIVLHFMWPSLCSQPPYNCFI